MAISSIVMLVIAVLILAGLFLVTNDARYLIVNAIQSVIIFSLACFIGISVLIDLLVVIISAIAGIPGAILVILLYVLDIDL
jgi:hypothetical protein